MINHGETIRTVRELLRVLARGARLIHAERWQTAIETGHAAWHVVLPDGHRRIVQASIAVAAHRRGLVTFERIEDLK